MVMMWIISCLVFGAIAKYLNKRYNISHLTIVYIIAAFLGAYSPELGYYPDHMVQAALKINARGALSIFFPCLFYNLGFNIDYSVFKNQYKQVKNIIRS